LGPVSRILFRAFRRFSRHFSRALSGRLSPSWSETPWRRTDATYPRLLDGPPSLLFCLAPDGVFRAARLAAERGGLLPHLFTLTRVFRGTRRRRFPWGSVLALRCRSLAYPFGLCIRWPSPPPPSLVFRILSAALTTPAIRVARGEEGRWSYSLPPASAESRRGAPL
jgi:hypothetical protein